MYIKYVEVSIFLNKLQEKMNVFNHILFFLDVAVYIYIYIYI